MGGRFWRFLGAYLTSTAGDEFYALALPMALLALGHPAATATFLRGAVMATTVVAGFLVGHLVDRHATDRLLRAAYLGSAAALAAAAGLIAAGADAYLVCLLAAGVLGLLAAVSAAAMDAGVPRLVSAAGQVRRGYSLVESARTTASILGPLGAGLVASFRGLALVAGLNALSFCVAGALVAAGGGRTPRTPGTSGTSGTSASGTPGTSGASGTSGTSRAPGRTAAWWQIAEGLRAVAGQRRLRLGISLSLLVNVTLGAEQPLLLARLMLDFRLPGAIVSAIVLASGGAAIAASLVLARWAGTASPRALMVGSVVVVAAGAAGTGLAGSPAAIAVLSCLSSAATICYTVNWRTYRQEAVDPELLGRVSATSRSLAYSGIVAGTLVAGLLQRLGWPAGTLLWLGGAACLLGTAAIAPCLRIGSLERSAS